MKVYPESVCRLPNPFARRYICRQFVVSGPGYTGLMQALQAASFWQQKAGNKKQATKSRQQKAGSKQQAANSRTE